MLDVRFNRVNYKYCRRPVDVLRRIDVEASQASHDQGAQTAYPERTRRVSEGQPPNDRAPRGRWGCDGADDPQNRRRARRRALGIDGGPRRMSSEENEETRDRILGAMLDLAPPRTEKPYASSGEVGDYLNLLPSSVAYHFTVL